MRKKVITREEVSEVLENYSIGELVSLTKLSRRLKNLQPSFVIKTAKGKFFLKQYWVFDYTKKEGLKFNLFLQRNNYPCNKVVLARNGKPFHKVGKTVISVFQYMSYREKHNLTTKEIFEYGKGLAKLHILTNKYKKLNEVHSPNYYYKEFKVSYHLTRSASKKVRAVFEKIKAEYPKAIKAVSKTPKGICHTEYTTQHTRYNCGKLVSVIDWDLVNRSHFLYDIGTAMSYFVKNNTIQPSKMKRFLEGYESVRRLTRIERENLFDGLELGSFKFLTWALDKEEIEKNRMEENKCFSH